MKSAFCIATDSTGVLVQPIRTHEKQRQACRRGHFFVQVADRDHVFFEYAPRETSGSVLSPGGRPLAASALLGGLPCTRRKAPTQRSTSAIVSWRVVRPLTASTISAKMLGGPRWSFRFPAYRDLLSLHADDAIAIAANELDRRGR